MQVREFTDGSGDGGLCEQVAELLKLLLDPDTLPEKVEKSGEFPGRMGAWGAW